MKKDISQASLPSGILTFLFIIVAILCGGGAYIVLLIYAAPGLLFGLTLVSSAEPTPPTFLTILFMIFSLAINIFCASRLLGDFMEGRPYVALKLVASSAIGAVMLSLCYDLLVARRFSLFYTIAMPVILGIAGSLFSAGCMYILVTGKYNEFVSGLLWIGMFTIFPLWQYLFGLNVRKHNRSIPSIERPDPAPPQS